MAVAAIGDGGRGQMAERRRSENVAGSRQVRLGPRAELAVRAARGATLWLARHWLALANGFFLALLAGATAPALLMAAGATGIAGPLFSAYGALCHQLPHRSFLLLGSQVAVCERDVAIYGTIGLAGLLFSLMGRGWRPLPWRWYFALLIPIAIDGTTQTLGIRESTWQLRLATGALFGVATVWLAYPHLERFTALVLSEAAEDRERSHEAI
jgi:uncharacterized membrane protein